MFGGSAPFGVCWGSLRFIAGFSHLVGPLHKMGVGTPVVIGVLNKP